LKNLKKISTGFDATQGEVGELELEETLRKLFPTDEIAEVKKESLVETSVRLLRPLKALSAG